MTLLLSDKDVRGISDMRSVIDNIEAALTAEAHDGRSVLPERMNLSLGPTLYRVMPALLPAAGVLGLKIFYGSLEEGVRYSVVVCALDGGEVLAVVDAAYLTALRTGATSGVATRHLARPDCRTVGLIGSGLEAETNLAAVCSVRDIDEVRVFSRSAERRCDFARRVGEVLGVAIEPVDAPQEAVAESDIVVVATNTGRGGDVAYRGEWMEPGQHVVSIGSTATFLREIDEDTLVRPEVVVFDAAASQVAAESGDVAAVVARRPGWQPTGTLDDVLTGRIGRRDRGQMTLFKSVGTAAQDLVAATAVMRSAAGRGIGVVVPDLNEPKQFS